MSLQIPSTTTPPQPKYVLRGHSAQIHALVFLRNNSRLLTGDADGWTVLWSVVTKRPLAVWRAHTQGILGLDVWREDTLITHGRDNKIRVWRLTVDDEAGLETTLPVEDPISERRAPWLLHALTVNAIGFCAFAKCVVQRRDGSADDMKATEDHQELLLAVPGIKTGDVAVWSLPAGTGHSYIKVSKDENTGMIMCLRLFCMNDRQNLTLAIGYESGVTATCRWINSQWVQVSTARPHSQPILSVATTPDCSVYFSSAADAIVARNRLDRDGAIRTETIDTKHAGQQSLRVRSDGRVLATAGWDGRIRVYSTASLQLLAVLKWHKEGCYAVAFADVSLPSTTPSTEIANPDSLAARTTPSIRRLRSAQEQSTHWLAAGSKDGKVSLWDIY